MEGACVKWIPHLLNMRIVVLFVRPGARELDGVAAGALTKRHQIGIDELTSIVGVESSQRERQAPFDHGQGLENTVLAFAQHGLALHPRGVNVHTIQGVQKLAASGGPGVRHQINFQIAGLGHIPVIRLDRDLVLQQGARARGAVEAA